MNQREARLRHEHLVEASPASLGAFRLRQYRLYRSVGFRETAVAGMLTLVLLAMAMGTLVSWGFDLRAAEEAQRASDKAEDEATARREVEQFFGALTHDG